MTDKLKLGGVYKTEWDNRPFRIIGLDNVEVFYDCLWDHDNAWTFSGNFKKKCYFYRTSKLIFDIKSTQIDLIPLTEQEQRAFRPDLQLRLGRTTELKWNDFKTSDFKGLKDKEFLSEKLHTDKVVLVPFGNKGGLKKGTIITADNGDNFECSELILKAKGLQESVNDQTSNGIGIYRLGFEKELPSFYIGEYRDRAGLLEV